MSDRGHRPQGPGRGCTCVEAPSRIQQRRESRNHRLPRHRSAMPFLIEALGPLSATSLSGSLAALGGCSQQNRIKTKERNVEGAAAPEVRILNQPAVFQWRVQYTLSMTAQTSARPGRNEPCRCGSGRKYKHCCLGKDDAEAAAVRAEAAVETPVPTSAAASSMPKRAPKPQTDQPWKTTSTRGFIPRSRTPRKVGGN